MARVCRLGLLSLSGHQCLLDCTGLHIVFASEVHVFLTPIEVDMLLGLERLIAIVESEGPCNEIS